MNLRALDSAVDDWVSFDAPSTPECSFGVWFLSRETCLNGPFGHIVAAGLLTGRSVSAIHFESDRIDRGLLSAEKSCLLSNAFLAEYRAWRSWQGHCRLQGLPPDPRNSSLH